MVTSVSRKQRLSGDITSYRVCNTNLDTLSEICAHSSGDGATSLDIPVSSTALYSVRVAAVNDVGEGPFSNEVQVEVVAPGEPLTEYPHYLKRSFLDIPMCHSCKCS